MNVAQGLTLTLKRQGIPIVGVSIGREFDRDTWRIDYAPSATPAHVAAAELLKSTYDPATDSSSANELKDADLDGLKALRALAEATFELKTTTWTKAQFLVRLKAIYRSL